MSPDQPVDITGRPRYLTRAALARRGLAPFTLIGWTIEGRDSTALSDLKLLGARGSDRRLSTSGLAHGSKFSVKVDGAESRGSSSVSHVAVGRSDATAILCRPKRMGGGGPQRAEAMRGGDAVRRPQR